MPEPQHGGGKHWPWACTTPTTVRSSEFASSSCIKGLSSLLSTRDTVGVIVDITLGRVGQFETDIQKSS